MDEKEHLFERFGLAPKSVDSDTLKKEKEALRCVCEKIMAKLNRKDAAVIIKNLNKIKDQRFEWVEG
jgi:DNA-binding HxlR family transcriptional regulator